MQADRVFDIVTESLHDNKLVSAAEAWRTSARERVSRPPEAEKLSWTQAAKTKRWTFNDLDFKRWFKCFTWTQKITGLALVILPLSPTVVGNCHCYEGTNGLKNLSSWQSNLLKPDFYYGKDCHTNTLTLLWKTKQRQNWAQTVFTLTPDINLMEYIMIWLESSCWDKESIFFFHINCSVQRKYTDDITILWVVDTSTESTRHRYPKLVGMSSISCSRGSLSGEGETGPAKIYIDKLLCMCLWFLNNISRHAYLNLICLAT